MKSALVYPIAARVVRPNNRSILGPFTRNSFARGRGNATETAEVADPAAKEHLARVIEAIETNRYGAGQAR